MLQLLGYALNLCQPEKQKCGLPVTGEYQRLELIRRLLEQTPEKSIHAERTGASGGNESE